jgi:hypothetical protein
MLDVASGASPARVRGVSLDKDIVRPLSSGAAWVVVNPLAPPRLWSSVAGAVAKGFESVVSDARAAVNAMMIQRAVGASAQAVARLQGVLVEPNLPLDAQLVGLVGHDNAVEIAISSGMRLFRARGAEPKRLLNNAQRAPGIVRGGLLVSTERLQRGDLFVFGSRDAFGTRSMGAVAALLAKSPDAPPAALVEAALASCRANGVGAALVVARVR